jgi:hypothetical protein
MIHARKKDIMHTTIVRTLRGVGAAVKETYQHPGCLDVLVAFRGQLYWAEIKNNPKTAEKDLTDSERELIDNFARVGVKIHVWCTPAEALKAIGAI